MEILGWEEDKGDEAVRSDRIGGEEAGLSQKVERENADAWRDLYYDDYSSAPMTVDN